MSVGHDPVEQLLENLRTSLKLYDQLVEIAETKQRHIIGNDVTQLQNDLHAEEQLLVAAEERNNARAELHTAACAALKAAPDTRTLEALCRYMPARIRSEFVRVRTALRDSIARLKDINRVNVSLINNSLALVEGLIGALFNTEQTSAYGPSGARPRTEVPAFSLDARA